MAWPGDFAALSRELDARAQVVAAHAQEIRSRWEGTPWRGAHRDRFAGTEDEVLRELDALRAQLECAAQEAGRVAGEFEGELRRLRDLARRITSWIESLPGPVLIDLPPPDSPEWDRVLQTVRTLGFPG